MPPSYYYAAGPPPGAGPAPPEMVIPGPTGSIAAVKRQLSGAVAALAVITSGALASACQVTPTAASAAGASISVDSLNTQLHTLETTVAGGCLLQLENANLTTLVGEGTGGPGTYSMTFTNAVLNNQVGDLLAQQFAASKGITVSRGRPGHGQDRLRVDPRRRDQPAGPDGPVPGDRLLLPVGQRDRHHRQGTARRPARLGVGGPGAQPGRRREAAGPRGRPLRPGGRRPTTPPTSRSSPRSAWAGS